MVEILTAGEILVEIMRKIRDIPLWVQGDFSGPYPSGAPAIFIDQAALLGHSAAMVGAVGNDDFGRRTVTRLHADGVDVSWVQMRDDATTAVAFVSYSTSGERVFIYHIANAAAGSFDIPSERELRDVRLFHVMGCSLMAGQELRERINRIAQIVKSGGGLVSFDPNIRVELLGDGDMEQIIGPVLGMTDILLPGEKELLSITGKDTVNEAADQLFSEGLSSLVMKRGGEGARYMDGSRNIEVRPYSVDETDPTGAGDAFDAGFICGFLEGLGPEESLRLASACGALNASQFGPMEGAFHRNYIEYFMNKHS
jgi:sugar/nucleoside kinase (ribokinase family)